MPGLPPPRIRRIYAHPSSCAAQSAQTTFIPVSSDYCAEKRARQQEEKEDAPCAAGVAEG
jgi:hypothetical protein